MESSIIYEIHFELLLLINITHFCCHAHAPGTALTFTVGEQPVKDFRMIERHFFKDKLVKSYDFASPFCMPNTTNTWEVSGVVVLE